SVNRSIVTKPEFFKDYAWHEQAFDAFFDLVGEFSDRLSGDRFDEAPRLVMQMRESRARSNVVKVRRNRANVFGDRPLVVVQDDNKTLGVGANIVERLVADAAGERRVARDNHDIFIPAAQISSDGHAQPGGKR